VSFIILGTPRQGVKASSSGLPRNIRYFNFYHDSLSEETSVVETMRALSQTPAIIQYTACLNGASNNYNYALSEPIDGQILLYENPNAITVLKDMRTFLSSAKTIKFQFYWTLDPIFSSSTSNLLKTYTSCTIRELMQFKIKGSQGKLSLLVEPISRNLYSKK